MGSGAAEVKHQMLEVLSEAVARKPGISDPSYALDVADHIRQLETENQALYAANTAHVKRVEELEAEAATEAHAFVVKVAQGAAAEIATLEARLASPTLGGMDWRLRAGDCHIEVEYIEDLYRVGFIVHDVHDHGSSMLWDTGSRDTVGAAIDALVAKLKEDRGG